MAANRIEQEKKQRGSRRWLDRRWVGKEKLGSDMVNQPPLLEPPSGLQVEFAHLA